jgi:hypothetical protein
LATKYNKSPLLVYDYAIGGYTVSGVKEQVNKFWLKGAGKNGGGEGSSWTANSSLFS